MSILSIYSYYAVVYDMKNWKQTAESLLAFFGAKAGKFAEKGVLAGEFAP